MSDADCKETLYQKVDKNDTSDVSLWVDVYDEFCGNIGKRLKNSEWEESYGLYELSCNIPIRQLEDFVNIFDKFKRETMIDFKLKVQ